MKHLRRRNMDALVTDPVNCLFLLTISPNIEPLCDKMCGQIISSVRRDNQSDHTFCHEHKQAQY